MNLTEILVVAIPTALVIFKLTALTLAAVWSVGSVFEQGSFLPVDGRRVPLNPVRSHAKKV